MVLRAVESSKLINDERSREGGAHHAGLDVMRRHCEENLYAGPQPCVSGSKTLQEKMSCAWARVVFTWLCLFLKSFQLDYYSLL